MATRPALAAALLLAAASSLPAAASAPADELAQTERNSAARSASPSLALKAYSLAYEAVQRRLVPRAVRESYVLHVLPALRRGCVAFVVTPESGLKGAAATYDDVLDQIRVPDIDASDPRQAAVLLHELVHVGQDAARLGQYRVNSEGEAYAAEVEYRLRKRGALSEDAGGRVAIRAGDISALDASEQLVIYGHAASNIEGRAAELNDFRDSSSSQPDAVPFKGNASSELLAYFRQKAESARGEHEGVWGISTMFTALKGSSVRDTGEFLQRDGLTRCP